METSPPELFHFKRSRMDSDEIVEINEMPKQTKRTNWFLKVLWLIPILVLAYIGWMSLVPIW